MSACVHHGVGRAIVREMNVVGAAVEGKLQNACSRRWELVAKGRHVRCDETEVLRNERQTTQLALHDPEEIGARPRHPFARFRGRGSGWTCQAAANARK